MTIVYSPVPSHGNATLSVEARYKDFHIRIDYYHSFQYYNVAKGEVRRYPGRARTPVASQGMLSAYSDFKPHHDPADPVGSAIPGNELTGTRYRIHAVGPKDRVVVPIDGHTDQYIQTSSIVEYLMDRADQLPVNPIVVPPPHKRPTSPEDWDQLLKGY